MRSQCIRLFVPPTILAIAAACIVQYRAYSISPIGPFEHPTSVHRDFPDTAETGNKRAIDRPVFNLASQTPTNTPQPPGYMQVVAHHVAPEAVSARNILTKLYTPGIPTAGRAGPGLQTRQRTLLPSNAGKTTTAVSGAEEQCGPHSVCIHLSEYADDADAVSTEAAADALFDVQNFGVFTTEIAGDVSILDEARISEELVAYVEQIGVPSIFPAVAREPATIASPPAASLLGTGLFFVIVASTWPARRRPRFGSG